MNETLSTIAIVIGIIVPLAGALTWIIHSIVAPLRVVIENNTVALERIMDRLDIHGNKLEDHSIRIACIETRNDLGGN
jgi:hypothetical protein